MKVLLASRNEGKVAELRRILSGFDVVGLELLPGFEPGPETGATFAENSLAKAAEAAAASGLLTVADDSGLCVDALNGMPGVLSARWCGRHGDDLANLRLLLGQLADVPEARRTARFVCAAAAVSPAGGAPLVAEGELSGRLTRVARGGGGFGYDPIFVPDGYEQTTAELAPAEKDRISHRGQAFRALARLLAG